MGRDGMSSPSVGGAAFSGATPIEGSDADYDGLLAEIGNARIVLIGEASHGTHDFYRERARITQRLIDEKGFMAVAVEGDWPDAYRANRYALGQSQDATARQALSDFQRFPAWMWRNTVVEGFLEWLRARNDAQSSPQTKTRFLGLDLYSLQASMQAVVAYLERVDPPAAKAARDRYSCFDVVGSEGQEYGYSVAMRLTLPCEAEVVEELVDLRQRCAWIISADGLVAEDEYFFAEQNARLVMNAERYYREMYRGRSSSWNLRDLHMFETLKALDSHLIGQFGESRIVVWEHNSHVGDARATYMAGAGQLNIGQLVRQEYSEDSFVIGFTTHHGTVTAADDWGARTKRKNVRPAIEGSYESRFHDVAQAADMPQFVVPSLRSADLGLPDIAFERAIGVIYRPETERASHWFRCRILDQFDAVIHIDRSRAVEPLERTALWDSGEPPETYPTGL